MRQLILDIRPDTPPNFDNYLAGANGEAITGLRAMAGAAPAYSGEHVIYLWGESGVGKSHLLQAWASVNDVAYHSTSPLPEADTTLLAVDDVETLPPPDQIRLFSILNSARENGGRIVAAGKQPPTQLSIRPDLATRLAQGLVFRLQTLTDIDKAQALAVRAEAHGMNLADDLIRYMLIHCRRDLPHLLATVDALDALSISKKRPVSLPLLKELLQSAALV